MKTIIMAFAILLASTAAFCQAKHTHKHTHTVASKKYTCSMHPDVVMNKPGKCPKCGMKLVEVKTKKTTEKIEEKTTDQ